MAYPKLTDITEMAVILMASTPQLGNQVDSSGPSLSPGCSRHGSAWVWALAGGLHYDMAGQMGRQVLLDLGGDPRSMVDDG